MWETIIRIVPCLIAAGIIGAIIGWALAKLLGEKSGAEERTALQTRLQAVERDLDKARGEARTHRDQVNLLKSDLTSTSDKLIARDKELSDFAVRIKSFELLEADLAVKKSEIGSLTAELDSMKSKLAAAEAALKKPPEPDPKLLAEIKSLKDGAATKDAEISTLLARVKELAPLGLQLKDRDLRLKEWDGKFAEAIKLKDGEIAALKSRASELEAELQGKESYVVSMQARLGDAESMTGKISELEGKLQAALADHASALSARDAEIAGFKTAIGELEPLKLQFANREARINELELSLNGKVDELAKLQSSLGEIDSLKSQIADCAGKLRDAESRLQSQESVPSVDPEISRLRSRIHDLEIMHQRAVNPPPEQEWDNLEAINGVGPILEKMLYRLGIYTFKQVAMWNDEQIDWVDSILEHFHGRIRRENWVESAKEEHFKKYGERI